MTTEGSTPQIQSRAFATAVRFFATLGIVFIASFETWHALTSIVTWRDWAHYVAAIGAIFFLSNAIKNGRWGIVGLQERT